MIQDICKVLVVFLFLLFHNDRKKPHICDELLQAEKNCEEGIWRENISMNFINNYPFKICKTIHNVQVFLRRISDHEDNILLRTKCQFR